MRNFTLLLLTLMAVGCGGQKSKKLESATPQTVHFKRVMPPVQSTPEAQFQYMVDHYWDRFDFTDTLFIERVDSAEMMRAYVEYIAQLQQASHMFDTIQEMSDSVEARMQVVFDSLDRAVEESNYDNFLGLYLFVNDGIRRYSTRAEVDSVVSLFAPELREHPYMIGALQVFEEAK